MTGLPLRFGAWALGIVVVLPGCATAPLVSGVDTLALQMEPCAVLEPPIVRAPRTEALRAPVVRERTIEEAEPPAPCALPCGSARPSASDCDVRALFTPRACPVDTTVDACPGGT